MAEQETRRDDLKTLGASDRQRHGAFWRCKHQRRWKSAEDQAQPTSEAEADKITQGNPKSIITPNYNNAQRMNETRMMEEQRTEGNEKNEEER